MLDTIAAKEVISRAKKHGDVKRIVVEVGDFSSTKAEDLEKLLKKFVNWAIEVIKKPAFVKCFCGYEGEPKVLERTKDFVMFCCPKCMLVPEDISGTKIILKKIILQ